MQRLSHAQLDELLGLLRDAGYLVIGPRVRDGAIVHAELASVAELPIGWRDEQQPGRYRLHQTGSGKLFDYVVGPDSPRNRLTPSAEPLVQIRRHPRGSEQAPGFEVTTALPIDEQPIALLGVRACDIAAMHSHDRVWTGGPFIEPRYRRRREQTLVIAVDCLVSGELCFCVATDTGPEVREDYDLCLSEIDADTLLLRIGSARGQAFANALMLAEATSEDRSRRAQGLEQSRTSMQARNEGLDFTAVPELLFANLDHPRWDDVAARCLSCSNCTLVCPTCFCHRVEEHAVVGEDHSERVRVWDSCFSSGHGQIHGAQFRPNTRSRYRQWMTHKLAGWVSQFGMNGCVGCGRCISWCPVGIDIRAELRAIQASPQPHAPAPQLPRVHEWSEVAGDPMLPQVARVVAVERELPDAVTLAVEPAGVFRHSPGQFNMVSLPEIGEVAISISGQRGSAILHTIRAVGATTDALNALVPGAEVGLRGPFGRGWPMADVRGRAVVVIAGGLGLAPLRGALREMVAHPEHYPSVRLLFGARSPDQVLYRDEILGWDPSITFHTGQPTRRGHVKVHVTVDHADASWTGHVGAVTTLMRSKPLPRHAIVLVCGPEIMMRFVFAELDALGIPMTQTYVSMERNMACAAGMCGRCQYGPHFVCKDGPVFRRDQIADLFGREGF